MHLKAVLGTFIMCATHAIGAQAGLVYTNDFDGNVQAGAGVSVAISGGTGSGGGIAGGITSVQGYAAYSAFGGDFWRITAPDDVLEFSISGVSTTQATSVSFSLAMIDSWDGTSGTFGTDVLNIAILDRTTLIAGVSESYSTGTAPSAGVVETVVSDQQLGFNMGNPYWNEDGYRMRFDGLLVSSGNLVVQFWGSSAGSGSGFQGGDDESFAIDNISVTPEPGACAYLLIFFVGVVFQRKRRFGGTASHCFT